MGSDISLDIERAIYSGEELLNKLDSLKKSTSSAKSLGIWDMLGGKSLVNLMKHSKISDMKKQAREVEIAMDDFQGRLNQVLQEDKIQVDIGGFLSFADFFFDGFLADFLVQNKLNEVSNKVDKASKNVRLILKDLKKKQKEFG